MGEEVISWGGGGGDSTGVQGTCVHMYNNK